MKIMIVGDNFNMRAMIGQLVRGEADELCECESGDDPCRMYDEIRPEWTLMEIAMNGMDGIEVTRNIRRKFPTAKIILLADYDDTDLRDIAIGAGASGYFTKERLTVIRDFLADPSASVTGAPGGDGI